MIRIVIEKHMPERKAPEDENLKIDRSRLP